MNIILYKIKGMNICIKNTVITRSKTIARSGDMKSELVNLHTKYVEDIKDIKKKYEKPNYDKIEVCKKELSDNRKKVKGVMKEICEAEIESIRNIISIISENNKVKKNKSVYDEYFVDDDDTEQKPKDENPNDFSKIDIDIII